MRVGGVPFLGLRSKVPQGEEFGPGGRLACSGCPQYVNIKYKKANAKFGKTIFSGEEEVMKKEDKRRKRRRKRKRKKER